MKQTSFTLHVVVYSLGLINMASKKEEGIEYIMFSLSILENIFQVLTKFQAYTYKHKHLEQQIKGSTVVVLRNCNGLEKMLV